MPHWARGILIFAAGGAVTVAVAAALHLLTSVEVSSGVAGLLGAVIGGGITAAGNQVMVGRQRATELLKQLKEHEFHLARLRIEQREQRLKDRTTWTRQTRTQQVAPVYEALSKVIAFSGR